MERKRVSQFFEKERIFFSWYRYRVYIFFIIVDSSLAQCADCCSEQEDEAIDGGKEYDKIHIA